jgi:hypothetical protein
MVMAGMLTLMAMATHARLRAMRLVVVRCALRLVEV